MELIIGDKVWSTWSMRPWLALKHTGAPFTERLVRLRQDSAETVRADILAAGSPSGLVPVLKDGELVLWDSLAICEYLAERFPAARLWPADPVACAIGRAAACEMHSGFSALRSECPMDLTLHTTLPVSAATAADLARLTELWCGLVARFGGPFLLGADWSIADAFFTPVATRVRSYGIDLAAHGDNGAAVAYLAALLAAPEYLAWEEGALSDERVLARSSAGH